MDVKWLNNQSSTRKDFTSIGSTVNLAARLLELGRDREEIAGVYVDSSTHERHHATHWDFGCLNETSLKGIKEKQTVYQLLT